MARVGINGDYYGDGSGVDNYGSDANASNFIPKLYAKKALRNFYLQTFYNDTCNTDYEGQIKGMGDQVVIRKTPEITVGTYEIGKTITYEVPKKDSALLTIDQAIYTAFQVDDIDKFQTDMSLLNMFADDAAYRMKIAIDADVLGYMGTGADANNAGAAAGAISGSIDLGTSINPLEITASNAVTTLVHINQVLDEANQPSENRWVVLPAWYCALLKLGDLKRADVTGDSTGLIRNGMLGMVDRTMIYQSNNLTVDSGNTLIVAGTKEATTFAAQISKVDTLKIQDSFGEWAHA